MKLSPTLDLSGAIEPFENIQPTPSFYEQKSSTPTTQELSVCLMLHIQLFLYIIVNHSLKLILTIGICRYG